jgi:hypothetical protein
VSCRPWNVLSKEFNYDTVQFASFLSTFNAGYKALFCLLRKLLSRSQKSGAWIHDGALQRKLAAFCAGSIAASAILLDQNQSRRTALCLYFLTRAGEFLVKFWYLQWRQRVYPVSQPSTSLDSPEESNSTESLDFKAGEALPLQQPLRDIKSVKVHQKRKFPDFIEASAGAFLMMISSSQILFSFVAMPETLAPSYLAFLLTHSGVRDKMGPLTAHHLRLIGRLLWRILGKPEFADKFVPLGKVPAKSLISTMALSPPSPTADEFLVSAWPHIADTNQHQFAICTLIHPDDPSCTSFAFLCFLKSMLRSAKLYLPLNIAMTLIFGIGRLKSSPKRALLRLILSTLRSSVFLAGYVTTAWTVTCTLRRVLGKESALFYIVNGMCSGAWSLVENRSRRMELALYCLPRALESFWSCLQLYGILPESPKNRASAQNMVWYKRILSDKRIGEPFYFMVAMGTLMMLFETENWVISPGYRTVMARFFGVN